MKVLVTGGAGQLGRELLRAAPAGSTISAPARSELDISDASQTSLLIGALRPDIIINAAAYTAVDRAENEVAAARACNVEGAANVAAAAAQIDARIVHVSSDYVFGGDAAHVHPYRPQDTVSPLNVYGRSKADGESAVLRTGANAVIVRSSWVYSRYGTNFVGTILRLCRQQPQLRVVSDQVGVPTWAAGLARCLWILAQRREVVGVRHYCDGGKASWYDFALAIRDEALQLGLLQRRTPINPVLTAEYPAPAHRPAYSVLDPGALSAELGIEPVPWRVQLASMLQELAVSDG